MGKFNTSVLRERFTIENRTGSAKPIIALSNRIAIDLADSDGRVVEHIIVRGQMLHTVVRMAASLLSTFQRTGPLLSRQVPINWEQIWAGAAGNHELQYNHDLWVAVYAGGKPVFHQGDRHPFLDVIEQCATIAGQPYDESLRVAEGLFQKAGQNVSILHDSNIALVVHAQGNTGKCGIVLRGAHRTTTFNLTAEKQNDGHRTTIDPVHLLTTAAAFLEGVHLSFIVGTGNEKLRLNLISAYSEEGMMISSARRRLSEANTAIGGFENTHDVFYRPEKPIFGELVTNAEQVARTRLEAVDRE